MISEQDKQAILNGAYGISRKGLKCKFIGFTKGSHSYIHMFIYFNEKGFITNTEHLNENLTNSTAFETPEDVIGLWEDKPEPFDLNRALNGEPVMLRNGLKAYVKYVMPKEYKGSHSMKGYVIDDKWSDGAYTLSWHLNGKAIEENCNHHLDIIGMYKEPKPQTNTVTLTLPCPLKEPRDEMWFISPWEEVSKSSYDRNMSERDFKERPYFASKADAQAWVDTLKNIGI